MNCHCGSGVSFDKCCEPYILKKSAPERLSEQLMRSRYSAFVVGAVDYIYDTHHPCRRRGFKG